MYILTTTSLMILYHNHVNQSLDCCYCRLYPCRPYCILHKSLLTAPIVSTSKTVLANLVRPGCYLVLWFYFTPLFLRRTWFSVLPLPAHNAAAEDCSWSVLGNSCTGELNSV